MNIRVLLASVVAATLASCGGGGGSGSHDLFTLSPTTVVGLFAGFGGTADFNGDGKQDVAVYHRDTATSMDDLAIFLGNGDGTFRAAGTVQGASRAVIGDMNGDGKADLVYCGGGNSVLVQLGNGDATFQSPVTYQASAPTGFCRFVAIGDVDGDGRADLIVAAADPPNPASGDLSDAQFLYVLRGNGDGTFRDAVLALHNDNKITRLAAADLNRDGRSDVVLTWLSADNFSTGVDARLAQADGTFGARIDVSGVVALQSPGVDAACCVDFNADGVPDVILSERVLHITDRFQAKRTFVLLGNGDGTFRNAGQVLDNTVVVYARSDFDRDGNVDLVVNHGDTPDTAKDTLLLYGTGNGTFAAPVPLLFPPDFIVTAGDFNGDSRPDLLLFKSTGLSTDPVNVYVMLNQIDHPH